ncbi:hypothetical protein EYZ11_002325 [Aspergillus tanneri]|uniref:MOZ protein represents a chromatin-associated acetyltransferase n=1 Tax=Aspergillus tanneri TaxID=1220188 RepID=A0A4S3JQZ3_9EURO|nr:uncharacterized protein ATNIH1004_010052 [Aspergillus tanneri]KAA8643285.1 hypothetical protein ATNIH1004_010052 [Aspergillus tanneri]THC98169.1 hypothetical protein EYZ11_002325 [Aspergillus tanneri]
MATPRLPFLYPNLIRAIRSCEPTTFRSIRIPSTSSSCQNASFHSSRRRKAQETSYHRRYGPAAEANLPPPARPKDDARPQPAPPMPKVSSNSSNPSNNTVPAEQSPPRDAKDAVLEASVRSKGQDVAESSDRKIPHEQELRQDSSPDTHCVEEFTPPGDNTQQERNTPPQSHPLDENLLEGVLHMPSPSSYLTPSEMPGSGDNHPNLTPAPYAHHFDTYSLVRDLSKGGFTEDQSVTIMKAVRRILHQNLDFAKQNLTSKSDVENESYLFQAACSELQSSLLTARSSEMQRQRASRTQLQHESDILSQRLNQELAGLKDDIKGMFNDHKMNTREQQRSIDTSVQELNYKITVSLNSDGKSEIEGLRWILTRRAALAVATSAFMIILFLNYYSVRKTQDNGEKKKEAPVKEKTKKPVVVYDSPVEPPLPVPELHLGETLG